MRTTIEMLLSVFVCILGLKVYELSGEVSSLKSRSDWTDTFMSKQDIEVKTAIHELSALSDKIVNTVVEQEKRIKEIQTK